MHLAKRLRKTTLSGTVLDENQSASMDEIGNTLNNFDFFQFIRTNNLTDFGNLLDIDNSLTNSISTDGFSGLQLAAKYGHLSMVEALLDRKAEPVSFDVKYGRTFLHWAAVNGHSDIVFLTIRDFPEVLKALIDLLDNKGYTSLMLAVKGGRKAIVSLLLAAGADVNIKIKVNNADKTVFDLCNNSSEMLSLLTNNRTLTQSRSSATDEPASVLLGSGDIQWGLSSGAGISQLAHNRTKCVALGWMKCSPAYFSSKEDISSPLLRSPACIRTSSEAFSAVDSENCVKSPTIQDVVVKLNLNPRELREEFAFREQLNSNNSSSNSGSSDSAVDDSTHYFVSAVCPNIITVTEKSQLWYGILLEKGVIDLHHLYVAMTQGSTHSRLLDLRWKLANIFRITRICNELLSRGLVWYDLKPSNFIVFPADENSAKIKQHKWIQQSSWDASTFKLKAADLSSIYGAGTSIAVNSVSCTAKFLSPVVAKLLIASSTSSDTTDSTTATSLSSDMTSNPSDSGVLLTTCPSHMLWSLGMCSLQLLDAQYSTVFAKLNLQHASEVYAFLNQDNDFIQRTIDEYVVELVDKLLEDYSQTKALVENRDEVTVGLRDGLLSLLHGLLRVEGDNQNSLLSALDQIKKILQVL